MEGAAYTKKLGCKNCKKDSVIHIQKGVTIEDHLSKDSKCPNCGCEALFRYA